MSSVTEIHHAQGSFNLSLKAQSNADLADIIKHDGHILVFDSWLDTDRFADADLLDMAKYVGVVLVKEPWADETPGLATIGGAHVHVWLRDTLYLDHRHFSGGTFDEIITSLLLRDDDSTGPIKKGTVTDPSSELTLWTGTIQANTTLLSALEFYLTTFSQKSNHAVEYKVRSDGYIDIATPSTLFNLDAPKVLLTRKQGGAVDGGVRAVTVTGRDESFDRPTDVVVQGEGIPPITGTAAQVSFPAGTESKDLHGQTIKRYKLVVEPDVQESDADDRAQLYLDYYNQILTQYTIELENFDVHALTMPGSGFGAGDAIYIWDPSNPTFEDTTNEVPHMGIRAYPKKMRVISTTWPILDGMGVYYRDGSGVYTDLTPWVIHEGPSATIVIAQTARPLIGDPAEVIGQFINMEELDPRTTPNTPTALTMEESGIYGSETLIAKAFFKLSWTAPTLNTDGSELLDEQDFLVRWMREPVSSDPEDWEGATVHWDEAALRIDNLEPGVEYTVKVAARDVFGNVSGYTSLTDQKVEDSKPDHPTNINVSSVETTPEHHYVDQDGRERSGMTITWTEAVNEDSTAIEDGRKTSIYYRIKNTGSYRRRDVEWVDSSGVRTPSVDPGASGTIIQDLDPQTLYEFYLTTTDISNHESARSHPNTEITTCHETGLHNRLYPKAPTGVSATGTAYTDARGLERGKLIISWTDPTQYKSNDTLPVAHISYIEVLCQRVGFSKWRSYQTTATGGANEIELVNLETAQDFYIKVRAVTIWGYKGDFSSPTTTGTTTGDGVAPSTPSTPVCKGVGSNSILVKHDVLKAAGGSLEGDLHQIRIYACPATETLEAKLAHHAGTVHADWQEVNTSSAKPIKKRITDYGDTDFVRGTSYKVGVVAVDHALNASALSAVATVTAGDFTAPPAPASFTVADGGIEGNVGTIHCSWSQVTTKDMDRYFIRWRLYNSSGDPSKDKKWSRHVVKAFDNKPGDAEVPVTAHGIHGLRANRTFEFAIRSVDAHGNCSDWLASTPSTIRVGADQTAPGYLPQPTLVINRGAVVVSFDLDTWGPLNPDARLIHVYMGTSANPTTHVGRILLDWEDLNNDPVHGAGHGAIVRKRVPFPAGTSKTTTFYARGRAQDWAGNLAIG